MCELILVRALQTRHNLHKNIAHIHLDRLPALQKEVHATVQRHSIPKSLVSVYLRSTLLSDSPLPGGLVASPLAFCLIEANISFCSHPGTEDEPDRGGGREGGQDPGDG